MEDTQKITRCRRIARLLADGKPYTGEQIQQALGLTQLEFHSCITQLRNMGRCTTAPIMYSITASGVEYAKKTKKAKTAAERMRKSRAKVARIEAKHVAIVAKRLETVVDSALASRPALQSVWGAMHA